MIDLLYHNANGINRQPDPERPHVMRMVLRPPEFMLVAFMGIVGGNEEVIWQGDSRKELETFAVEKGLTHHPRKLSLRTWERKHVKGAAARELIRIAVQLEER